MGWSVGEYARHERGLMVPSPWLPLWAQVPGCPADFFQEKGLIAQPWPDPCKLPQASTAAVPSLRSTGASCPQSPASCHCPATAARAPHSRHRRGAGCPLIHHPERPPVRPALSSLGLAAVVVSARPCPCLCPYPYPSCACSSSWWSCLPPGGHRAVKRRAKRPSSLHPTPARVPEVPLCPSSSFSSSHPWQEHGLPYLHRRSCLRPLQYPDPTWSQELRAQYSSYLPHCSPCGRMPPAPAQRDPSCSAAGTQGTWVGAGPGHCLHGVPHQTYPKGPHALETRPRGVGGWGYHRVSTLHPQRALLGPHHTLPGLCVALKIGVIHDKGQHLGCNGSLRVALRRHGWLLRALPAA